MQRFLLSMQGEILLILLILLLLGEILLIEDPVSVTMNPDACSKICARSFKKVHKDVTNFLARLADIIIIMTIDFLLFFCWNLSH